MIDLSGVSELTALMNADAGESGRPDAPPRRDRTRLTLAVLGLALYLGVVLWATTSPTPLDRGYSDSIGKLLGVLHRNGVPEWFDYSALEFTANIAMFVPFGFLLALALPQRAWWVSLLLVPAFSVAIELTQHTLLAERFATVQDIAANSIGGYVGVLTAFAVRAAVHARDQRLILRAQWEWGNV